MPIDESMFKSLESSDNTIFVVTNNESLPMRVLLSEEQVESYHNTLKIFSENSFKDDVWVIKQYQERLPKLIEFPNSIDNPDKMLLKAFALSNIALDLRLSTCKRKLYDCIEYFEYLNKNGLYFESTINIILSKFVEYLSSNLSLSETQRFSIVSSVNDLLDFSMEQGIFHGKILSIVPDENWSKKDNVKRAPEETIMNQLDSWFFNLQNDIPIVFRCIYLIQRLILSRFSEVQSIQFDDITYPAENIFCLRIPTFKETPLHTYFYKEHNRFMNGRAEQILLDTLLHQQEYARSVQDKLKNVDKGFLLVSAQTGSLISNTQFNSYLEKICNKKRISSADGEIAHVTSHHLRHVGIVERNSSKYSSMEIAKNEAAHINIETTMSYSYRSIIDEYVDNERIVSNAFKDIITNRNTVIENEKISPKKYEQLTNQPFVRVIPGYGLCNDSTCKPRYEQCFRCHNFRADPCYKEFFIECIEIVKERMKRYNGHTFNEVVKFDENQLAIYNLYLQKIQCESENIRIG